jgi:PAS domain S-box-containing protein
VRQCRALRAPATKDVKLTIDDWNEPEQLRARVHALALRVDELEAERVRLMETRDEVEQAPSTVSMRSPEVRNRAMLEAVPDLIFLLNAEGRILDCKPSPTVPLLRPMSDYVGQLVTEIFPEDVAERHAAIVREVAATGEQRFDIYPTDDERRYEEAFFTRTRGNVVLAIRDVTKRVLAEQERDRLAFTVEAKIDELRQWKSLADRAPDAIALTNLEGIVTYANAAFGALIGRETFEDSNVAQFFARAEDYAAIDQKLRSRGSFRGDLEIIRADGTVIVAHVVVFVITNERGKPTSLGCILRDRTDEIRGEEDRRHLQDAVIEGHEKLILELETPLLPVAKGVLVMPLVGRIDARRAERIMTALLGGVVEHRARVVILDITGVPVVDDEVAGGLVRAAKAVQLLGAETLLAGVGPQVARQLVTYADEIAALRPCSTLERGVAIALSMRRDRR